MSEPERTPHAEQPAEGEDSGEESGVGRTPHSDDPAEGADTAPPDDDPAILSRRLLRTWTGTGRADRRC